VGKKAIQSTKVERHRDAERGGGSGEREEVRVRNVRYRRRERSFNWRKGGRINREGRREGEQG